jgi:hypothetical protein
LKRESLSVFDLKTKSGLAEPGSLEIAGKAAFKRERSMQLKTRCSDYLLVFACGPSDKKEIKVSIFGVFKSSQPGFGKIKKKRQDPTMKLNIFTMIAMSEGEKI